MDNWAEALSQEKRKAYFIKTLDFVDQQRASGKVIFPPEHQVFSALCLTELDKVKVVILGQDPYHGPNQAHGLCFSVLPQMKIPPSLKNIYKELASDIGDFEVPTHGFLQSWAEQGVLMLNSVLTVEQGQAHSHAKIGWERFTDTVIQTISDHSQGIVFLLWGSHAQKKGAMIDKQKHIILQAPHPSPLSAHRGFLGCKHFSRTNELLLKQGKQPINWQV